MPPPLSIPGPDKTGRNPTEQARTATPRKLINFKPMKRNEFIKTTALAAGALSLPVPLSAGATRPAPFDRLPSLGIQLFSLPRSLENDTEAALGMLRDMGYSEIELYGPYPFSDARNRESWASLTPLLGFSGSGYYGRDEASFKELVTGHGLRIPSLHTDLYTLEAHMPALGAAARAMGATYVTLPAIPDDQRKTLDDYKRMADRFNAIGKAAAAEGIRFAYHNHGYGLQATGGVVPFEVMIDATDPQTVFLEMDIFWTKAGRANPVEYLRKYRGRYRMMHLKDMKELQYFAGDGGDAGQWMALFPNMASAGAGVLDLDAIVSAALETGVEHFFVEQDMVANPETALKESLDYLKSL